LKVQKYLPKTLAFIFCLNIYNYCKHLEWHMAISLYYNKAKKSPLNFSAKFGWMILHLSMERKHN
jgi:hypothetical protein